jgi:hypothetical protein
MQVIFNSVCVPFLDNKKTRGCVRGIEKSKHSLRVHERSAEACLVGGASRAEIQKAIRSVKTGF